MNNFTYMRTQHMNYFIYMIITLFYYMKTIQSYIFEIL